MRTDFIFILYTTLIRVYTTAVRVIVVLNLFRQLELPAPHLEHNPRAALLHYLKLGAC